MKSGREWGNNAQKIVIQTTNCFIQNSQKKCGINAPIYKEFIYQC